MAEDIELITAEQINLGDFILIGVDKRIYKYKSGKNVPKIVAPIAILTDDIVFIEDGSNRILSIVRNEVEIYHAPHSSSVEG